MKLNEAVNKASDRLTRATGSPYTIIGAFLIIAVWAACGPLFHFSEIWQMVINTGTSIITFLMVFIIQLSSNKDVMAIQIKLNELVKAHEQADNDIIAIEDLTDEELLVIKTSRAKKPVDSC